MEEKHVGDFLWIFPMVEEKTKRVTPIHFPVFFPLNFQNKGTLTFHQHMSFHEKMQMLHELMV